MIPSARGSTGRATAALATLASTPLLLGGFTPFTWTAAGCAVATAAITLPERGTLQLSRTQTRLAALALAAIAIGLLQLVALPAALAAALAPGAAALDRALGGSAAWTTLSRDPGATREVVLALLLGAVTLAVVSAAARDRAARRTLLALVVLAAAVVAALGVTEAFLSRPLLRVELPPHARPFGPFANRNHAAALLLLALPIAAGLAHDLERERRPRLAGAAFMTAGLLLLALVLNGSRGGLLAALVLVGAVALRARGRLGGKLALATLGALALAIVIPGAAWARRHELTTIDERLNLVRDACGMAAAAPLTGIGLGAFGAAYPPHQTVALDLRFRHVESEPVELLVEGGAPLLIVGLLAAATIAALCWRVVARRGAAWSEAGAALGVATVLAHACCDFPLRVPGVVLPLLLVLGVVLAIDAEAAT